MKSALKRITLFLTGLLVGAAAVYLSEHSIVYRQTIYLKGEHLGFRIGMSKKEALDVVVRKFEAKGQDYMATYGLLISPWPKGSPHIYEYEDPEDRRKMLRWDGWSFTLNADSWPQKYTHLRFCEDELIVISKWTQFLESI